MTETSLKFDANIEAVQVFKGGCHLALAPSPLVTLSHELPSCRGTVKTPDGQLHEIQLAFRDDYKDWITISAPKNSVLVGCRVSVTLNGPHADRVRKLSLALDLLAEVAKGVFDRSRFRQRTVAQMGEIAHFCIDIDRQPENMDYIIIDRSMRSRILNSDSMRGDARYGEIGFYEMSNIPDNMAFRGTIRLTKAWMKFYA